METKARSYLAVIAANQNIKERDYWSKKLAGANRKTGLLYDYSKNIDGEPAVGELKFNTAGELFSKLTALSSNSDYSLHIVLAAVLTLLLYKYDHADDLMIGTPIYKQDMEIEFINTVLVLRNRLTAGMSFKDLLLQVKQTVLEATEHQNYPIDVLYERLDIPLPADGNPFFDIALSVENIHDKKYIADSGYRVLFSFLRTGTGLEGVVEYDTRLYRETSIQRIIRHFTHVLKTVIANVDVKIEDIDLFTGEDKEQILRDFNHTGMDYPRGKTVCHLFEEQVEKTPGNIAVVGPAAAVRDETLHPEMALSYLELDRAAGRLAAILVGKGVRANSIVAVMMMPSIEMILSLWAILKAGGAYLPIEPEYPAERIFYMLADSRAKLLLTCRSVFKEGDSAFEKKGGTFAGLDIDTIFVEDAVGNRSYRTHMSYSAVPGSDVGARRAVPETAYPHLRPAPAPATCLAYIIYTSGSTGKPKGVLVNHGNLMANLFAFYAEFDIKPSDSVVQLSHYTFDAFSEEFFPVLLRGGKLVIPVFGEYLDIRKLGESIHRHKISMVDCSPLLLNELNKLDSLKSVRLFISGGDVLRESYIDRLSETGEVYNTYGPTETTVCVAYYKYKKGETGSSIPIGRPIANYNVFILDDSLRMMPVGVVGEICVSGPGVTRGYLNRPELTADMFTKQKFCSNFFNPAARGADKGFGLEVPSSGGVPEGRGGLAPTSNFQLLYKTGDLGRWLADGCIEFHGRKDLQVKIRGFRIEIGEIESLLLKRNDIDEAAVTVREGCDGDKFLCAYIVPAGETIDETELRRDLSGTLPDYMIPAFFVQMEKLPVSSGGKVDRNALPPLEAVKNDNYEAPRNEIEEKLTEIWAEILNIDKDTIGIDDNFFEMGGQSLNAVRMLSIIHMRLEVELSLKDIFRTPYIRQLASIISKSVKKDYMDIEITEKKEYYELSYSQKRIWDLKRANPQDISYNLPGWITLDSEIDEKIVRGVLAKLVERHDSLRTCFKEVNGLPVQVVENNAPISFRFVDISTLPESEKEQERGRVFEKEKRASFDISRPPLFRSVLVKSGAERYDFIFFVYHIVADGWSWEILRKNFEILYEGARTGRDTALQPLKLRYIDFAAWQTAKLKNPLVIKSAHGFWSELLKNGLPVLELPGDFPGSENKGDKQGIAYRDVIGDDLKEQLKKLAADNNTSLFIVLFTIFNLMLARLTGSKDVLCRVPTTGREHLALHPVVGHFINPIFLVNRVEDNDPKDFTGFLHRVDENMVNAFRYQWYPLEPVLEELQLDYPDSSISFNMINMFAGTTSAVLKDSGSFPIPGAAVEKFSLCLELVEYKNGILINWRSKKELFKISALERMAKQYKRLVTEVAKN